MGFKVFLSYSLDAAEQTLAWRLQTLAAAHGVEMYVPPRGPLAPHQSASATVMHNAIDRADCVLAIITAKPSANVQRELRYALAKQKRVIPIVHSDLAGHPLLAQFPQVFTFSPLDNPGTVEGKIVDFLKGQKVSKDQQQAIGALAAVGIGLLMLFSLSEK